MYSTWTDSRKATLGELVHRARSLLALQVRRGRTAEKEGPWTEAVRRSMKCLRGKRSYGPWGKRGCSTCAEQKKQKKLDLP